MKLKNVNKGKLKELSLKGVALVTILTFLALNLLLLIHSWPTESISDADLKNPDTGISLIEKSAQMGDLVIVDFKGKINGKEFENGSAKNAMIALGSGQMIPGFEKEIVGHGVGETFSIDLTFPEEYDKQVAGKDVTFEITIKELWRNIGTMHE